MKFKTGNIVNQINDKSRIVKVLSYDDTKYFNGRLVSQNHSDDVDLFEEEDFEMNSTENFKIYLNEIDNS